MRALSGRTQILHQGSRLSLTIGKDPEQIRIFLALVKRNIFSLKQSNFKFFLSKNRELLGFCSIQIAESV
jgi:4'-phosphopantetheinyl transferase EntD